MGFLLLHNPRCSKSRAALDLLEQRGVPFEVRDYQQQPLSADELRILRKRLGMPPRDWIRWDEPEAQALDREAPEQDLIRAVAQHPKLLQRPILIKGDEARVGRPGPENLVPLIDATVADAT